MVLDDEYGEFEMLNIEIVKLVEEFDGWSFPKFDSLDSYKDEDGYSLSRLWEDEGLGHYYENDILSQDEQKSLKELLVTERNEEHFQTVSKYICWVADNLDWQSDHKDNLRFSDEYDHFILGQEIKSEYHSNWCKSSIGRICFFEQYYATKYFEKMLPLYVESLRRLLVKAPNLATQQEAA